MYKLAAARFSSIILAACVVSGCLPIIFTGATGAALEMAKDKTAYDSVKDISLTTAIEADLARRNFKKLYTKIKVKVVEGRVFLTGSVNSSAEAMQAVQICWNREGVTEVINEMQIDPASDNFDLVQYTRDGMITAQIKSRIFINRDIKFVNYTVVTVKDIVYLFGLARSEEELETVADIAANVHGVKKVVSHVKIKPKNKAENTKPYIENINENINEDEITPLAE